MTATAGETLTALLARMDALEPGVEYPVSENFCRECQSADLALVMKLEATDGALAGVMPKTSARSWPYLRCRGCGRESRGKA